MAALSLSPRRTRLYFVLLMGMFAVSTGAIFARFAQEAGAPSLLISAGRVWVAALLVTPLVMRRYRPQLQRLSRRDIGLCLLAGAVLGVHFAAWISSLEYTSVLASVVIVTTNPLFVVLLSYPFLGERVSRIVIIGIMVAFVGGIIVALSGDAGAPPTRAEPLLGNGLALIGSIAAALYFIIGRRSRAKLDLWPYIWLVYGSAGVALLPILALTGTPIAGFALMAYVWVIASGIVPQLVGHSAFNYALGYMPAALVSLLVLGEPIASTLLALIFLNEVPTLLALMGSAVILAGIVIATQRGR